MAPRKKTTTVATRTAAKSDARATRSAIQRGLAILNAPVDNPQPRKKRKVESPSPSPSPAAPAPAPAAASSAAAGGSSSAAGATSSSAAKTVIIEYCLQGDLFKKKADQIRKALEKVAAVNIVVNPVAPRVGCFEIREEGGDAFVSLVDLESPFDELKAVVVKEVVADIAKRIK